MRPEVRVQAMALPAANVGFGSKCEEFSVIKFSPFRH